MNFTAVSNSVPTKLPNIPKPQFGTIHISIPLAAHTNPLDVSHKLRNSIPRLSEVNTEAQSIPLPHGRSAVHPYPPGRPLSPQDFKDAFRAEYIKKTNRLAFTIEEDKLPLNLLTQLLGALFTLTHIPGITRSPHYALYTFSNLSERLEDVYSTLIDHAGEVIFQLAQGRPGIHEQLVKDIESGHPPHPARQESRESGSVAYDEYRKETYDD